MRTSREQIASMVAGGAVTPMPRLVNAWTDLWDAIRSEVEETAWRNIRIVAGGGHH
jgi:hypothetical protein